MTAGAVVVLMAAAAQQAVAAPANATGGWHGLGWDLPATQKPASVPGEKGGLVPHPGGVASAALPKVAWPKADSHEVSLPPSGGTPADDKSAVTVRRAARSGTHAAGKVKLDVLDQAQSDRAGVRGTLVRVSAAGGDTTGPLDVNLDYTPFAKAFGADYGSRLRLVEYPSCILTTPDQPQCRTKTPVQSSNDAKSDRLIGQTAFAPAATSMVLAAEAEDQGDGGDFKATDLKPAGSWTSGGSTGAFSYSYPLAVSAGPTGKGPDISLDYSSDAVDGLTSATNNQASPIGDGWSLSGGGYIERSYKSCAADLGGNNGQDKQNGDLCYFSDNATISFAGSNDMLVKDKNNPSGWHTKIDQGSKIEKLTGVANGTQGGEAWKLTTIDGTQYFFGLNHLPGWQNGNAETHSAWTEPVFGNNPGEPCYHTAFADSSCANTAWRWNLDYSVDPHGNATVYYYDTETNAYSVNNNTAAPTNYVRGGYLSRIEYGFNTRVANVYSTPPARVVFGTTERCLPDASFSCDPAQLTKDNATHWPDVPFDRICTVGTNCLNASATFFSRKRYTTITGQVTDGNGGWKPAVSWTLGQSYPASGDGNSPALWLDSITQTGLANTSGTQPALSLPPTLFHGVPKANRVDATHNYTALTRLRIDSVTNSTGGVTTVKYAEPECVTGVKMPASPENNTLACYPVYWTPGGATDPILDWFNKYPVTDITEDARTGLADSGTQSGVRSTFSQQILTHYDYLGGAAWHHDDNPLSDPKYRTWSQFRGYGQVKTTKGAAIGDPSGPQTVTETRYLRGMDGDAQPNGGHRSVSVPSFWGENVTDLEQYAGFTRESLTYLAGNVIADALSDPWRSPNPTATDTDGFQSYYTGTAVQRTRVWSDSSQQWQTSRTVTTFGDYGLPTSAETDGALNGTTPDPAQTKCATTTYLPNTSVWILNAVERTTEYAGTCASAATSSTIVSDTKNSFDSQPYGTPPTIGDVTQSDVLDAWPAGGAETFRAPDQTTTFDQYGRSLKVADHRGIATTTAYTPATGGPVTQIATTTPPISATDTRTFTSTKVLDPVSGSVLSETDNSGLRTDATYDPLGRITAVWAPGHDKTRNAQPSTTYEYLVTADAGKISYVATNSLLANAHYATSYALIDGLGRTVQTQAPTPYAQGGRVLSDSLYDSQGRVYISHNNYWNGDSGPDKTLHVVQDNAVPNSTFTTYDSAGRTIGAAYALDGTEQWRTTTRYDGLRTTTIPPVGGTAMALVNNGLGQNVQTLQYHDRDHTGPTDPADVTTYAYARNGQLATVTDATGKNTWTTAYDLHDRKVSATDPDTGTSTYAYDDADQLTTSTDAQHRTLAFTYDNLGRKTAEYQGTTSGTKLADWTYDTVRPGLPTGSTHYVDGRSYSTAVTGYDNAGRATGNRYTIPAFETGLGGTYSFSTEYDPLTGAVATTTSPQKGGVPRETIYHDYGTLGQPIGLRASSSTGGLLYLVSETDYTPQAQVLRTNFQDPTSPYQVAVTNTYENGTNRLASTLAQRATSTGYDITNRQYTYQPAGNLIKLADTPQDGTSDVQCFTYDYRQRLTDAWTPSSADCSAQASAAALGGAAPYWTSWGYDAEDNRIKQVQHSTGGDATTTTTYPDPGAAKPHAPQTVTRVSGNTTSTSTYGYDDTGRTLTRGPAGAGQAFTYDAEGNIASVTEADGKTSTYVYDADGNRLITRDPTGVTLTIGDTELHVAAGSTTAIGTRYYSYNGQPIAERNGVAGVSWLMSDAQGTVYATVDAANLAVHKRYQDPYGVPRGTADGPWADNHGFLGGYQNTSGLTHLGAREYDPVTGAFISPDPLLDPMNPLHLNAYTYGFDNPIANTDPTGLEPMLDECRNADDRLACENWGYTADLDSFYQPYKRSGVKLCNWSRDCLSKNAEVLNKGRHAPTRERAEQIYREYHHEGMTIKEILQVGWEMTGIPDAISCVNDPSWSDCLSAVATVLPVGKGAKFIKGLVESERAKRALDFVKDIDEVTKEEPLACPIGLAHSFTGDTRVLMADGTSKPISDVKVGDKITNTDPDSGKLEQHAVTAIHVTADDRDRVDVQLAGGGDQVIHATEHHQIWEARTHHWVEAGQLQPNDQVRSSTSIATVVRVLHHVGRGKTYDLTVENQHTYYVLAGNTPVLVHNSLSCDGVSPNGWPKPTMDNCKECAQKIQDRIGGQIYHVKDSEGAPGLGPSTNDPNGSWTEHYAVIKDGTAYDAFTGPEGMPIDQYRAQWQYGDYLSFTPYNP
ncbi:RHS repeat-associated core domain-containing protein [Amycolatopsis carbonis]|uniref:RHS repeat-associated core domain-containing protein n=1 Tax=Amycolatopsis carbonis TaxID=715471 RepID=A0A9Y2IGC4_9PSEU|nr:RHS repeat-associated core domain-containing protein [Amycolatopsis sp. 2-15]WIX79247.1 RHS repeat-associated core domain-containing protein [Amycolatopsis sp. 2-15]